MVLEFTDENFQKEVLESDKPVLIDFWAEWCSPCLMIAPIIQHILLNFSIKSLIYICYKYKKRDNFHCPYLIFQNNLITY